MCVFVLLLALSCLAQCLHVHGFSHYKQVSNIKLSQTYLSSKQKYVHPKSSFMMISHRNPDLKQQIFSPSTISKSIEIIWKFTRPHTIIGSSVSIISLYLYSIPVSLWSSNLVWSSIIMAAIPSLFMNLYITGLNQVFDVQIDEVNKPYLPMASKELSKPAGIAIVLISLLLSYLTTDLSQWPLVMTLVGSWFFGTIYSVPPFRLKRFPLLAALCILVVRGFLINIGFFLHAKIQVLGLSIPNLVRGIKSFPESVLVSLFFVVFGIVIAFLKDVPDIEGDEKFNIPSLSVQYGAKSIFSVSWKILFVLLGGSSLANAIFALSTGLSGIARTLRLIVSTSLSLMAFDVLIRAKKVDIALPSAIFDFYLHIWNIFYLCYALLPLLK